MSKELIRLGGTVHKMTLGLLAALAVALCAPAAHAGVTCSWIPSMCPAPNSHDGGHNGNQSVPEPGTLGLLALGAAASAGMLRRKSKNKKR